MTKTRLQTKEDADGSLRRSDTLLELERTFPSSETEVNQGYLDHHGDSFDSVELKQEKKPLVKPLSMDSPQKDTSNNKLDATAEKYLSLREMTPLQERMNAVTIAPNPIYCAYFILAGHWISQELMEEYRDQVKLSVDESQCIQSSWFPALSAVPPATVIAVFIAITVHAPFSFLYHWKYAIELSPLQRSSHWSRRMDHSMIHTASAIISYATSGSWQYTLANILFNMDCIYRQFQPKVCSSYYYYSCCSGIFLHPPGRGVFKSQRPNVQKGSVFDIQ